MRRALHRRHPLGPMLLVGLLQVAAYFWAGVAAREDAGYALPQPDTFFYCQAARRIVEGHPFSFSEGTAVSTGTTTVAYPFLLAVPYALGCTGDRLLYAGFALNAAFYLVFLVAWAAVIRRKFADDPGGALVAGLLVALFGQVAYVTFAQSDTGMWLAASGLFAAALASSAPRLLAAVLVIGPWVRPEGMICALAFALLTPFAPRDDRRREFGIAALAGLSCAGVFALNWALTGEAQFASVAQKGYFRNLPFAEAVLATGRDIWTNLRDVFFGVPAGGRARTWYLPPLVAAAAFWLGVFSHRWRGPSVRAELVWLLAVAGGYATVVTSGWQDTNMDRYLAWTMPTVLLFAAGGVSAVRRRLRGFGAASGLLGAALVAFTAVGSVVMLAFFRGGVAGIDFERAFAVRMERTLEKGASVGTFCNCSMAYLLSPRRFVHLMGIYSPEMRCPIGSSALEKLKNEPRLRFDSWYDEGALGLLFPDGESDSLGTPVLADDYGHVLYRADWTAFDRAAEPPVPDGFALADRLDIAYGADEERTGFAGLPGMPPPAAVFVMCGRSPKGMLVEGGRIVRAGFACSLALRPGRDAALFLRTAGAGKEFTFDGLRRKGRQISFPAAFEVAVEIDGRPAGCFHVHADGPDFTDVRLDVPGELISASPCRTVLRGNFPAFALWACQETERNAVERNHDDEAHD